MNIAVLIGISDYGSSITSLPGSKNDVLKIDGLIRATKKYDEIITISDEKSSARIKDKLTTFVNSKKGSKVDEFLFYFTGHGDFSNDDFYYILTDFSFDKKAQTSLQNSELDNLIKSLDPSLVVKIVDACHSGMSYIKDIEAVDTYIKSTINQFNKCYFLYSSLNSQSSFQTSQFSFFTLGVLNAIKKFEGDEIRFKDVIDFVSDEFTNFPDQTPFFVTQADFTEIFCKKNEALSKILNELPSTFPSTVEEKGNEVSFSSFEDIVKSDALNNLSQEDVVNLLNEIKNFVENFNLDSEIKNLYQYKFDFPKYISQHANYSQVGEFINKNQSKYFAKPTFRTETYDEIEFPTKMNVLYGKPKEPYTVTKSRDVIIGYSLNIYFPYVQIIIQANSLYQNIDSYNCTIAFVTSDREIKLYYFISNYQKENWKDRKLNARFEWNANEFQLRDKAAIFEFIESINKNLNVRIVQDLNRQFKDQIKK
jgi:Caspase domain.